MSNYQYFKVKTPFPSLALMIFSEYMNFSTLTGFLMGVAVIAYSVTSGIDNSMVFLDVHAAVIVLGGTLAVSLIMFPVRHLGHITKVYLRALSGKGSTKTIDTIYEIVDIAKGQQSGQNLNQLAEKAKNPFLKESILLLAKGGFNEEDLDDILETRLQIQNEEYKHHATTYKVLGKFPPAFGLTGATLGMIALLQGLGQEGAFEKLGPAMSIALVATFYGLIVANVFVIPMGEKLAQASEEDLNLRRIVIDGVKLIRLKKHPLLVEEYLISYLKPVERNTVAKQA
jgi:chemotaxis protein MotA